MGLGKGGRVKRKVRGSEVTEVVIRDPGRSYYGTAEFIRGGPGTRNYKGIVLRLVSCFFTEICSTGDPSFGLEERF